MSEMVNQNSKKGVIMSLSKIDEYLQKNRADFEKHKNAEKERERRTMERGMVYWINT